MCSRLARRSSRAMLARGVRAGEPARGATSRPGNRGARVSSPWRFEARARAPASRGRARSPLPGTAESTPRATTSARAMPADGIVPPPRPCRSSPSRGRHRVAPRAEGPITCAGCSTAGRGHRPAVAGGADPHLRFARARARPRSAGCPASRAGCTRALSRGACGSRTSTKARRSRSSTPSCPRRRRAVGAGDPSAPARRTLNATPWCWAWTCCASRRARTSWSVWICSPCPDEAYLERYADDLKTTRDAFADLSLSTPSARFYEDARLSPPARSRGRTRAPWPPAAARAAAAAGVESVPHGIQRPTCAAPRATRAGGAGRRTDARRRQVRSTRGDPTRGLLDRPAPAPRAAGRGAMDVASNVVVLEENQNIYDRAKRDRGSRGCRVVRAVSLPRVTPPTPRRRRRRSARCRDRGARRRESRRGAGVRAGGARGRSERHAVRRDDRGETFEEEETRARSRRDEETAAAQDAHDDWQRERDSPRAGSSRGVSRGKPGQSARRAKCFFRAGAPSPRA